MDKGISKTTDILGVSHVEDHQRNRICPRARYGHVDVWRHKTAIVFS